MLAKIGNEWASLTWMASLLDTWSAWHPDYWLTAKPLSLCLLFKANLQTLSLQDCSKFLIISIKIKLLLFFARIQSNALYLKASCESKISCVTLLSLVGQSRQPICAQRSHLSVVPLWSCCSISSDVMKGHCIEKNWLELFGETNHRLVLCSHFSAHTQPNKLWSF